MTLSFHLYFCVLLHRVLCLLVFVIEKNSNLAKNFSRCHSRLKQRINNSKIYCQPNKCDEQQIVNIRGR
uniref:Secreted protein n=1 Tax=Panagrolaimus sp. JU765 TaxID=591449 RepID=A0AC34RGH9_9BILA